MIPPPSFNPPSCRPQDHHYPIFTSFRLPFLGLIMLVVVGQRDIVDWAVTKYQTTAYDAVIESRIWDNNDAPIVRSTSMSRGDRVTCKSNETLSSLAADTDTDDDDGGGGGDDDDDDLATTATGGGSLGNLSGFIALLRHGRPCCGASSNTC